MLHIIEVAPQSNGAHANQTVNEITWDGGDIPGWIPEGWAIIPEDVPIPGTFPFVGVEAANGVVTALTPGIVPPPEPGPEPGPTMEDIVKTLIGG